MAHSPINRLPKTFLAVRKLLDAGFAKKLGLTDTKEPARCVGDRCRELVEQPIADEVRVVRPVGRREISVLQHGVSQAIGRPEAEGEVVTG